MTNPATTAPAHLLELKRVLKAPRAKVWRCWTDGSLYPIWFCPKPWFVKEARLDLRAGGSSVVVMQGPNGEVVPNAGIYLAVEPERRLVFTDAFSSAWVPAGKPFMVGEILLADAPGGGTGYTARAMHWSAEDLKQHEAMGFHAGWGVAADQLDALALTL